MATIIPVVDAALASLRIRESFGRAFESLEESMRVVRSALERYDRTMLGLVDEARAHGRRGWTLPMLMGVNAVPTVLKKLHEIDDLDALFDRFYANEANISRLFDDLVGLETLTQWKPLLAECIASFRDGRFLVVVPSLFLIFEGVFAVAAKSFERKVNIAQLSAARLKLVTDGQDSTIWGSLEGFGDELFRPHNFADAAPARLNRHWVLHGRSPTNWTRLDCLRLFQAIHTTESQIEKSKGGSEHMDA
jgi:hypothetical protein